MGSIISFIEIIMQKCFYVNNFKCNIKQKLRDNFNVKCNS